MWPRGNVHEQLANIATALREARGNNELALLIDLEARYDELLDDRNRVAAMLPEQPRPVD